MRRHFTSFLSALLLSTAVFAQTTGRLAGEVEDEAGAPLPGVTVTAESPAQIGGPRVATTDEGGLFGFPRLAPGRYVVRLALDGFATQERTDVEVRVDRTSEIFVTMPSATVTDEIVVTADTPVVDTEQVSMTQTFTEEYLQNTSIGSTNRSYLALFDQIPGVDNDAGNAVVFGSTSDENAYLVDGLDTTDPVTATFGVQLNFDAIQEVAVHTGGYEAEYGRATGGVVSVVTKSGGNELEGSLDTRWRDTSLTESGDHFDPDENENDQLDVTATLGGPLQQDKLWYFLAAETFEAERTTPGDPVALDVESQTYLAKLTYALDESWQLSGKWSADPAEFSNVITQPQDTLDTLNVQEQGGDLVSLALDAVLGDRAIWDLKAQALRQELDAYPQSGDFETPGVLDLATSTSSQNYVNEQYSDRDRDELRSTFTYFLDELAGSHELKAGAEYSDLFFRSRNDVVGELVYYDDSSIVGPYFFQTYPDAPEEEDTGEIVGLFAQDAWRINPRVTVKLGVRWDEATFETNAGGGEVASLDEIQPRLGIAWDLTGDGRTLARFSAGRFMHPNALTLPSFGRPDVAPPSEQWVSCSWTEAVFGIPADQCAAGLLGDVTADPLGRDPFGWWFAGLVTSGDPNLVDPGLQAMYSDEIILGIEREITNRTSIELSYIDKTTEDIFEDTCNGNLDTPGGGATTVCDYYVMTNLPELAREYQAATLQLESRATDWMHLRASYTWSKAEGNIEDTQNGGIDYDWLPAHSQNTYGYLSYDRRHAVRVTGYFRLPYDVSVGLNGFYASAFPYDVTQSSVTLDLAPYGRTFVEPRGSRRANSNYSLDLEVGKAFDVGPVRAKLIASVFNALGSERPIQVCENVEGCGGSELGDPLRYTRPRSYEAGLRITF